MINNNESFYSLIIFRDNHGNPIFSTGKRELEDYLGFIELIRKTNGNNAIIYSSGKMSFSVAMRAYSLILESSTRGNIPESELPSLLEKLKGELAK